MYKKNVKKIILSGGGTGGSAVPLFNIRRRLEKEKSFEFLFLGGKRGIERTLAKEENIPFRGVFSGKFRRYFDWRNFIDPFFVFLGFLESLWIISREKPDLLISAGSFISVPAVWAAWFFKVPVLLIQLDVRPGLANRFMAPVAEKIAVVFEKSVVDYGIKAVWTGVPFQISDFRFQISDKDFFAKYGLKNNLPLVLVIGGGTGSIFINKLLKEVSSELVNVCNIIHITGSGKKLSVQRDNYKQFEFLGHDDLMVIMKKADLVVSRAGLGTISELVDLRKPAIIIPMPESHQEDNAKALSDAGAAMILEERGLSPEGFVRNLKNLLSNQDLRKDLSEKIGVFMKRRGAENIINIINKILQS